VKGSKIFNFQFLRMLNKIQENQRPNAPVILGCYKNAIPSNVKFSIRASQIEDLNGAMNKATEMEELCWRLMQIQISFLVEFKEKLIHSLLTSGTQVVQLNVDMWHWKANERLPHGNLPLANIG
jgi:hypothetical protein